MLPITPRKLEYFTVIKNPDRARALFKESVGRVGISISSYCNRQCTYCPNSIVDRKSAQNFMSDDLFFSIMRQLSKIDYDGEINVTRYNEPLADKEYALSRLRDIRVFLPDATIHIFTNGDYLDRPYLDELAGLGVNRITATVHAGPGGKTDIDSLTTEQDRRLRELDLPYTLGNQTREDRYRIATVPVGEHLVLDYVAHDFYRGAEKGNAWAFDRGGVLPIPKTVTRISPSGHRSHRDVPFPAGLAVSSTGTLYVVAFSIAPEGGLGVPGSSGQVWRMNW